MDNALNVAISYQEDNNSTKQILDDFGKRFQDKGVFDVKSKSIKEGNITNEYLGNFMYGVLGTIAGIEDKFLISAGAAQQVLHNKNNTPDFDKKSSKEDLMIETAKQYMYGRLNDLLFGYNLHNYGQGDNNKNNEGKSDTDKIIDGIKTANKYGAYGDKISPVDATDAYLMPDSFKDFFDNFSYFFNPFDHRWQGKDPNWLEYIKDYWKNFFSPTADAELYDPLTLDLNNDGKISTLNLSNGVYFDHNKDGVSFKTSWIGK